MPAPSPRARANLLLTLTAAIWGLGFVAQRMGAEQVGPFSFNAVRFALGALSLLPLIALLGRGRQVPRPSWRVAAGPAALATAWPSAIPGLIAGFLLFTASAFQQIGIETTTAGKAGFITGLYIVLVPVLGLALRHRTTTATWVGIGLALVGLYLITVAEDLTVATGDLLVLIGAFFWALHILVIGHYTQRVDALRLAAAQFAACAVFSGLTALAVENHPFGGLGNAVLPLLYGGVIVVGVAYTLQVVAQRDAKPAHAAMILSLETVFGAIGGALILGEQMTPRVYSGCALMLTGILISQWRTGEVGGHAIPVPEPLPTNAVDEAAEPAG